MRTGTAALSRAAAPAELLHKGAMMAWDLALDSLTHDLTGGIVSGQEEIAQRIKVRLLRILGEWFVNTDAGLPWYRGPSPIGNGEMIPETAILGSRSKKYVDTWIRNEISETEGVEYVLDYNSIFDTQARTVSIRAQVVTAFGLPFVFALDTTSLLRTSLKKEIAEL